MNRLVIIDGNAILHRAYHALPPLTDPNGEIINAVYGFVSMLLKIKTDLDPQYLAVTFDRPAPTFRKEIYKEYQATRPKMDDDLILQVDKVHEVVKSMGIPIFEMDGYEADDIIGTLVKLTADKTDQIIIVTGDRDILQLVEEGKIFVYMPTKGLSEAKLYGEKEVKERMGVMPKQIPDFKALAGDSSDNYPGVEGIGPKTAVSIIEQAGNIRELYNRLENGENIDISPAVIDKLKKGKENAILSHDLATIRIDVPLEIDLKAINSLNTMEARETFIKFGFKTLLKRLTGEESKDQRLITKEKNKEEKPKDDSQQSLF